MGNWWNDDASDLQYSVKVDEQDIKIDLFRIGVLVCGN